jgi:hypothetical protein
METPCFKIYLIYGSLLAYLTNKRATPAHYIRKISGRPVRLLTS